MRLIPSRRTWKLAALGCGAAMVTALVLDRVCPPPIERLHAWPSSPLLTCRHGEPLAAWVAADDQWRLPVGLEGAGPWLPSATMAVEDERFALHPGVDPLAITRAATQGVAAGRVVSGASTLTMQIARMIEPHPRTLLGKLQEAARAVQLETRTSKDELLAFYLDTAPYGSNLRGVEAASLRWFGCSARDLSLAEAALIAGLPQSPERLRPDRHPDAAIARRNHVLDRMLDEGHIDVFRHAEARQEPLRLHTEAWRPVTAPHFAAWARTRWHQDGRTTLDVTLQHGVDRLVREHLRNLPAGTHAAVTVVEVGNSAVRAHVGGQDPQHPGHGALDLARARRSPGSALKPFVYAAAFESGRLDWDGILEDAPIERDGWQPRNFDRRWHGDVRADDALRRSLNVPAILALERVGVGTAVGALQSCGVSLTAEAAESAGLSLAVGGADVRLVDLVEAWATLARGGRHMDLRLFEDEPLEPRTALRADTSARIVNILSSDHRVPAGWIPGRSHAPEISWKTGTSAGFRDAWAVGTSGGYAIGVWIGRVDGSGDPAYLGGRAAEPLLTRIAFQLAEMNP
tara:strand:- start:121 stop:1839 length:1719 start_codon:yes stop_codon:yes gene_type:complete